MPKVARKSNTARMSSPFTRPSPTISNLPQPSPQASQPLGPTPIASPSPSSQNNDGSGNNNEQSDQTPPVSETSSSIDKRKLITIYNKKSMYPKEAFEMLKVIVHSHFDGPYTTWTSVDPKLKEFWWNKWKKLFRWDEEEEIVWKVFNHKGSKHLTHIFQKARSKNYTAPAWIKDDIWAELKKIWEAEEFQQQSDQNKQNRAVSTEKDMSPFRGGSRSTTDHKRKLTEELGKVPNPKEMFERCYGKKDGTFGNKMAEEIVDKYDGLVEQATQDAASNGSNSIDTNILWITAVGGPKKDSILGMGSEAHSMIQGTKSGVQDVSVEARQNLREQLRAEFMAEFSSIRSDLGEKVHQVESSLVEKVKQVENSLGEKVQQVENCLGEKVKQLEGSLQLVESTIGDKVDLMHKRIDNLVDKETLFETMTKVLRTHLSSSS